jgi:hypothetical protein
LKGKVKLQPYNVIHSQLGHMGEEATRKVARYFEWQISQGTSSPCIACSEIKVKKKSFGVKANHFEASLPKIYGRRILSDWY